MIKDTPETEPPFQTNIGRPNLFGEHDYFFWDKVFDLIELSTIPIVVNGAYARVRELCTKRKGYGGGGFAFIFWFQNQEDRDAFLVEYNVIRDLCQISP